MSTKTAKLTKTQRKLIAQVRDGRVFVQTHVYRSGYMKTSEGGAREWSAAEGLIKLGLAELIERKSESTYVRSSMGHRREAWTNHQYRLTDAGLALQAEILAAARAEGRAALQAGESLYHSPYAYGPQRDAWQAGWREERRT